MAAPERVLIQEICHPLTGRTQFTTRFGDITSPKPTQPGRYPTPPPPVIMFPKHFYDKVVGTRGTDKVVLINGIENDIDEDRQVLTIAADNGSFDYDIHPAYWPLGPDENDWFVGTLR